MEELFFEDFREDSPVSAHSGCSGADDVCAQSKIFERIKSTHDLEELRRITTKIYRDGQLEFSLRKKLQSEVTSLRSNNEAVKKAREELKARKKERDRKRRIPFIPSDASASRVNVGFYTLVQQLRRDLKIANEDRRALRRELALARQVIREQAEKIKKLEHELAILRKKVFGKSNERGRGQEAKLRAKGHGRQRTPESSKKKPSRRSYDHLPAVEEHAELRPEERCCKTCGKAYLDRGHVETSEHIERKVDAYRRLLIRHKYQKACQCASSPPYLRAPLPVKTLDESILGDSILSHLLLQKYLHQIPLKRILSELRTTGCDLSSVTVNDTLRRLFERMQSLGVELDLRSTKDRHWHSDETSWRVVETLDGKRTFRRWHLWVIVSESVARYLITRSRGSSVLDRYFDGVEGGYLTSDRYTVYRSIEVCGRMIVGYCWAHVRRDFIRVFESDETTENWAFWWLKAIRILYRLNDRRLAFEAGTKEFTRHERRIIRLTTRMHQQATREAKKLKNNLQVKTVKRLLKHWKGLTNFIAHPILPLDNNTAERALRLMVLGRHAYHGSGGIWASQLAALMFSIFQTLAIWKVNEQKWLELLFAKLKAKQDDTLGEILPWNLSPEVLSRLRGC